MQFFKTLFIVSAAIAGHVAAAPNAKPAAVGHAGEAPGMVARAVPARQTKPEQGDNEFDVSNWLSGFTGNAATDNAATDNEGDGSLFATIGSYTQDVIDKIDSGSLNFDKMAYDALSFVNKTVSDLDLNKVAGKIGHETSRLATRAVDTETIPGGSIIQWIASTGKSLLSQVDIDSIIQSAMSASMGALDYVNINKIIKTILGMVKFFMG